MVALFFITPRSAIKIGSKAVEFVPIIGPRVEYLKNAKKLTGISDPVTAGSRGIGMLFKSCFGKTDTITLECALWLTCSAAGGVTGNPLLIALGAEMGNQVIDELLP